MYKITESPLYTPAIRETLPFLPKIHSQTKDSSLSFSHYSYLCRHHLLSKKLSNYYKLQPFKMSFKDIVKFTT